MNQFIGKQFDQYQIGPLLGEGGMGAVYHAHDLKNNRPVALKIMLANLTNKPHFRQRFQQEAEICASFNSPTIIKIYGNGEVDGYPYLAMEYIEGGSLTNYISQVSWGGNKLPLDEVLALSAQIAEGLAYAHQRGLVHRDIKPDNILLKLRDGAAGSPRQAIISDFGLAVQLKTLDDAATNPFMGSLAYMSPEQCENSGLDGRSDIYALGILLYELATGQLPFQINAPADIVKHLDETPLPPSLINPKLPQQVEDIILKAIAKKPNERYQTAAEMAHALRQLAADKSLLTAVPLENQNAVTQWLENRWVASVNVQDRVDTSKTWTTEGRYRLFVTSQHEESKIHGLNKPVITIGRNADNDIVLEDRTVSARHTSLSMSGNSNGNVSGWVVRDLGSTNGSYLGDRALAFDKDVQWSGEEVLRIGPYHLKWQLFSGEEDEIGEQGAGIGVLALGTAAVGAAAFTNGANKSNNEPMPAVDFDGGTAVSSSENLSVAITPETAVLEPEIELPIDITITNTGITVQEVDIRLFDNSGTHPIWVQLRENRVKLLPEESASLVAIANLPANFHMASGEHPLNVQATSDRGESETAVITIVRPDSELFTLDIHPSNLQEDVLCRVTIRDESNFTNAYTVMGIDDADALLFDFGEPQNAILSNFDTNQQTFKVDAHNEASTSFTIRPKKRPLFGNDKPHPFKIRVRTETADWQTLTGQVDIHARISRRLVIFLMLLTMLLCLLGFGVYSMVAADRAEEQRQNQEKLDSIGATATAAQAEANQAFSEVENAQATANALSAAGDVEGAANAQATADALEFGANATQAAANALQNEIESLTAAIDATATPPPPPTSLTLGGDNVDEDAPIGAIIGTFTASSVAYLNTNPTGLSANKSTGAGRLFRTNSQSAELFTYSIVGGDADAFFIDGDVLKTAVLFDFETQNSYDITVLADNGFDGTIEVDFTIAINDVSDTPQLTISNVSVDEGDGTAVLTVLMTGSTQSEVTVDYSTSDGTAAAGDDYEESGDTLTWAPGETGERDIEIALVDDAIQESAETFTVTLEKAVIAEIDRETAVVTISDDESTPTISITSASAKEGDGEAIVIVTMTGQSSEDVTVSYATKDGTASKDSDYSEDAGELVWAAGTDGDIEIAISFEDDEMDEPSESLSVVLSNAANGTIASSTATVTIEDDDDAPVLTIESAGPFAENAVEAVLTVVIEGSSSQEVEVSYATSDDTTTVGKDYTDTNGTIAWEAESTSPQEITVPILSDTIFEAEDETFIVTLSAPVNATIATGEESYAITDDDDQPTLSISDITVDENDGSAVLTVLLTGGSSTEVTVEYTTVDDTATVAGDDYNQTASPPVLTWAANEQDSSREISVVIKDDDVDEGTSEAFLVNLLNNSDNSILSTSSATVTITDDDEAAIIVDKTSLTIKEPSTNGSFNVRLTSEPTNPVKIPLSSEDSGQCTVPLEIIINPSDWNDGVNVTVTVVEDRIDEDDGVSCKITTGDPTSGDELYQALEAADVGDVAVTVNDDDTAKVLISPLSLTISETTGSNTGTFRITLNSQPTSDVEIPLRSQNTEQCTIANSIVTLTDATWETGKDVVVTAVDEDLIDDTSSCVIETQAITKGDSKYLAFKGPDIDDVSITVTNNDKAGAVVSPTSITISETTATVGVPFNISLTNEPSVFVEFRLSVNNDCALSASTAKIIPANWMVGADVDVTSINDNIEDGDTNCLVTIGEAVSGDDNYNAIIDPEDVNIIVLDDDAIGISQSGISASATEGGATGSYTFVLGSEPTDTVTIAFSSAIFEIEPIADMVFTVGDWDTAQTVTVTAVNDNFQEIPHLNDTITHAVTSNDAKYNGFTLADVDVTITDNDTAGITIIHTSSTPDVSESGAITDTYGIVLDSQPRFDVTIGISPDGELKVNEGAGAIDFITIISSTWDVTRTLTITAVNDLLDEAELYTGTITHTSSSSDGDYGASVIFTLGDSLTINIADDDSTPIIDAGQIVTISETALVNTTLTPVLTAVDTDANADGPPFTWVMNVGSVVPITGTLYFEVDPNTDDSLRLTTQGAADLDYETQITYTVELEASDGTNTSLPETVTIRVDNEDDEPPVLNPNTGTTLNEGATITLTTSMLDVSDVDTDNDTLLFSLTGSTPFNGRIDNNGTLSVTMFTRLDLFNNQITYVHDSTETRSDSLEFDVLDGSGNDLLAQTFAITITNVDDTDPVIAANTGITVSEGMSITITTDHLNVTDTESVDGTLVLTITTPVTNGRLELSDSPGVTLTTGMTFTQADLAAGKLVYVHDGSETTADSFTFDVTDISGNDLIGEVFTIAVTPVNDAPIAYSDTYTVTEAIPTTIATTILSNDTDAENVPAILTAVTATLPTSGTLDLDSSGIFTYTSNTNTCGTDSFTYHANDDQGMNSILPATVTINITCVDDPPTATVTGTLSAPEGQPTTITTGYLSANDVDTIDSNIVFSTTTPAYGVLKLDGVTTTTFTQADLANDKVEYVHDGTELILTDIFSFTVRDGTTTLPIQPFNITITPQPDPPTITVNTALTVTEEMSATINTTHLSASDDDTIDANIVFSTTTPSHGELQLNGTVTTTFTQDDLVNDRVEYMHNGDEPQLSGFVDSFDFIVSDGINILPSDTFSITITPVNDPPIAVTDSYTVTEGFTLTVAIANSILDNDTDADSEPISLTAVLSSTTPLGPLDLYSSGIFTYTTSDPDYCGTDSFAYRTDDGESTSDPAIVTINITCVDDPPTLITNTQLTALEGITTTITTAHLSATDIDTTDDNIVFRAAGLLTLQYGELQLTNGTITTTIVSFTQADLVAGRVLYAHDGTELPLTDSFGFTVEDSTNTLAEVPFNITITPVNDTPIAINDVYTVTEDTTLVVNLTGDLLVANDIDDDNDPSQLTVITSTNPISSSIFTLDTGNNGAFTYRAIDNYCGTDSFDYQTNDLESTSNVATVTITITCVDDPPTLITNTQLTALEGMTTTITTTHLYLSDIDTIDANIVFTTTTPSHGRLEIGGTTVTTFTQANVVANEVEYVNNGDEPPVSGIGDSFDFVASDGTTSLPNTTFNISVTEVNDPPVANPDSYTVDEAITWTATITNVLDNDTDADIPAQILTAITTTSPTSGTLVFINTGVFTYTSDVNTCGTDSFDYKANDGNGSDSNDTTVTINITCVDDPPTVVSTTLTLDEATTETISTTHLSATDIDTIDANIVFTITTDVLNGELQLNDGGSIITPVVTFTQANLVDGWVQYAHNGSETITDTFTFEVGDLGGNVLANNVFSITVTPVNDPPVANPDTYTVDEAITWTTTITNVLDNDTDADIPAQILTAITTTSPTSGTLDFISTGEFTYTSDANTCGTDSFNYKANDGVVDSNAITVTINITCDATPPNLVTTPVDLLLGEGLTETITTSHLNATDANTNDGDIVFTIVAPVLQNGRLQLNHGGGITTAITTTFTQANLAANEVQYVHDGTETTSDKFDFTLTDSNGKETPIGSPFTLNIAITLTNDMPDASDFTTSATATNLVQIPISTLITDEETNIIKAGSLTTTPTISTTLGYITITNKANGDIEFIDYTPITDTTGVDTFEYRICDDGDIGPTGNPSVPSTDIKCDSATITINLTVASGKPTFFIAQNPNVKPLFVLGKQGDDGVITAVLTHQELIPSSDTVRLDMYLSLQNADGSPNTAGIVAETAVLLADGSLYPATISQEPGYAVIAVDASDSMSSLLDPLRNATIALVDGIAAGSSVAVMRYDENIDLIQSFSNDPAVISNALNSIQIEQDATCTYDAAYAGMQALVQTAPNSPNRTLVLVSDGVDRDANGAIAAACSNYTEAQAITYATANNIVIHIIGSNGINSLPIAQLASGTSGTISVINEQSPTVDGAMLASFSSQWIASATMQPAQGLQRGAALLTLADGTTPEPVPVQFVSPRNYVVEKTAVFSKTIDISNFRYDSLRDQFQMDVALGDLTDVQVLRVELLDSVTRVQAGLGIVTDPHFSQRVVIPAAGLTGEHTYVARAYVLNSNTSMIRNENGETVETSYTFQHTPANLPTKLTIQSVTVEDKAATFDLSGIDLQNDPPKMHVEFELENGEKVAAINGRLLNLDNKIPSETFTVTAAMNGEFGTASIVRERLDEGRYTLVLDALDENGRSLANDDAQFNYTAPDNDLGRAGKALVNNPLLWFLFFVVLAIVAIVVWSGGQQVGKKKGEASNVTLNSPLAVAEVVEDEIVDVQLTVLESPDSILFTDGNSKVWKIDNFPFTIGRDGCDLNIANDQHVSRKHAQIIFVEGDHFIEDLRSANGTFLNATKLTANEPISLSPERGERITIGKTTTLSFNES